MTAWMRLPLRTAIALGVALAYGGSLWLVALHHAEGGHERGEPALLLHWLRDGTLALPGVLAAVLVAASLLLCLVDGDRRLPAAWRSALLAAGAALGAAVVLAAGSPLHAWLFAAEEGHGLPFAVHFARDALVALAPSLLVAGVVVAVAARMTAARPAPAARMTAARMTPVAPPQPAAPPAPPPAPALRPATSLVSRRAFVGYGAAGLATAGVAGTLASRTRPARAQVARDRLELFINEGHVPMVDGSMVYMRGFGAAAGDDPSPNLVIEPQVFLAGGTGPIDSRHYPVNGAAEVHGSDGPTSAGIDDRDVGLHHIHRRRWASCFPRRTIVAETGSLIRLRITNRLREPHAFQINGVVSETLAPAGSPGATKDIEFPAPGPGTYIYHDPTGGPVNRVLGLNGVLVVVPAGNPWTYDGHEGEFERQWLWILHDIDPEWGRRASLGSAIDPARSPCLPRYFTINGRSGVYAAGVSPDEEENHRVHEDTTPCGHGRSVDVRRFDDPSRGTGQLIRLVNTGIAIHQPHFHGNHVWTIAVDNKVYSRSTPTIGPDGHVQLQCFEDVVELDPLRTKTVMLPMKPPPDALDEVIAAQSCTWVFPMHCHAEMSQTAGGGLYPGGMVSDWKLKP